MSPVFLLMIMFSGLGLSSAMKVLISPRLMQARRVQHIGAGFGISVQAAQRLAKRIGVVHQITFGSRGEQHSARGGVDGGARGADAIDS